MIYHHVQAQCVFSNPGKNILKICIFIFNIIQVQNYYFNFFKDIFKIKYKNK